MRSDKGERYGRGLFDTSVWREIFKRKSYNKDNADEEENAEPKKSLYTIIWHFIIVFVSFVLVFSLSFVCQFFFWEGAVFAGSQKHNNATSEAA